MIGPGFRCAHRIAALAFLVAGAVAAGAAVAHGPDHNPLRAQHVMKHGMPHAYHGLKNPLEPTTENLTAGARLYEENCALCHGPSGEGDGEAAAELEPRPPSLTVMYKMPMMGMGEGQVGQKTMEGMSGMAAEGPMAGHNLDAYSFWTVTEGGEVIGSAMPAYKEALSDEERWQIILFLTNGLSASPPG